MIDMVKLLNAEKITISFCIEKEIDAEFVSNFMRKHMLTPTALANIFCVSTRKVSRWTKGTQKVKEGNKMLFTLLDNNPDLIEKLRKVTPSKMAYCPTCNKFVGTKIKKTTETFKRNGIETTVPATIRYCEECGEALIDATLLDEELSTVYTLENIVKYYSKRRKYPYAIRKRMVK